MASVYDVTVDNELKKAIDVARNDLLNISKSDAVKVLKRLNKSTFIQYSNLGKLKTPAQLGISRQYGADIGEMVLPSEIKLSTTDINKMSRNELLNEIRINRDFLLAETSTSIGYREWQEEISNTLGRSEGFDYARLTENQKRKFWEVYNDLEALSAEMGDEGPWQYLDSGERAKLVWEYQHTNFGSLSQEEKDTLFISRMNEARMRMIARQSAEYGR